MFSFGLNRGTLDVFPRKRNRPPTYQTVSLCPLCICLQAAGRQIKDFFSSKLSEKQSLCLVPLVASGAEWITTWENSRANVASNKGLRSWIRYHSRRETGFRLSHLLCMQHSLMKQKEEVKDREPIRTFLPSKMTDFTVHIQNCTVAIHLFHRLFYDEKSI